MALPRRQATLVAVCAPILFPSEIRPQDVVDEEIGDPVRDLQVPRSLEKRKDGSVGFVRRLLPLHHVSVAVIIFFHTDLLYPLYSL